jgi:hypothetical protein
MRIRTCRKEAKERAYRLKIINETNDLNNLNKAIRLFNEAIDLKKIFSSLI